MTEPKMEQTVENKENYVDETKLGMKYSPVSSHQNLSSPIRKRPERSPSPVRRRAKIIAPNESYRQHAASLRLPNYSSFSSYMPIEKPKYSSVSLWMKDALYKTYPEHAARSTYTSMFDDIVSAGPFSRNLYSTSRLIERSRSRSREQQVATRLSRSDSYYNRRTLNYMPVTYRNRDFSTPPISTIRYAPSRSGSFLSFMEYSGQKQHELARSSSRLLAYDGLSRTSSRSSIEMFYNSGRLSRVDSYIRDMDRRFEYDFPSNYTRCSTFRSYLPQIYAPAAGYRVCCSLFIAKISNHHF
ncbi:unnamed protein product [Thelazia callipaeda]|uniref:DUF4005 domain-containing protein n=1 Tax=Thelazia callipaeda TaxID=103827 RepID=A0A0N5CNK8_THECL|nr:unnamed protein product [Thelazia callipaeda]